MSNQFELFDKSYQLELFYKEDTKKLDEGN